jgi:hypothetical protein
VAFFEKYGTAIFIAIAIFAVLGLTPIGAVIGRLAMLGTMGLLIWLAFRLLMVGEWKDRAYWQYNSAIGAGIVFLGAITVFVMWADPRMPNLSTGECRVSRYESC